MSRIQIPPERVERIEEQCTQAINKLVKSADKDEWLKWIERLWNAEDLP